MDGYICCAMFSEEVVRRDSLSSEPKDGYLRVEVEHLRILEKRRDIVLIFFKYLFLEYIPVSLSHMG